MCTGNGKQDHKHATVHACGKRDNTKSNLSDISLQVFKKATGSTQSPQRMCTIQAWAGVSAFVLRQLPMQHLKQC